MNVAETILSLLSTDLLKITIANGYENTILQAIKGGVLMKDFTEFPVASYALGPEKPFETDRSGRTIKLIRVPLYIEILFASDNDPGKLTDECESLIKDLKKHLYRDASINPDYWSRLFDVEEIDAVLSPEVFRGFEWKDNKGRILFITTIEYKENAESIELEPIVLPSQITLTSPADGYTSGDVSDADFEWVEDPEADTYHIQIASDTGFASIVYQQDNLLFTKHTVPDSLLTANVQYYWRVSGKNQWGYGAWSAARSWKAVPFAYEAEATALFAAMSVQPDTTRKGLINTLIKGLKDNGLWDKAKLLVIPACHAEADALLDWKGVYNATAFNAPAFVVDRGYTGNGTTQYIATGYNINLSSQNSFSMFFYSGTDVAEDKMVMGIYSAGIFETRLGLRLVAGARFYFSANSAASDFTTNQNSLGDFGLSRLLAGTCKGYRDGHLVSTAARNSIAPVSAEVFVLGANNGSGVLVNASTAQCRAYRIFEGLTDAEVSIQNILIRTYLDAIGAGV